MKLKKILPLFFLATFIATIVFITLPLTSYKYTKKKTQPETKLSGTLPNTLSDNHITLNDETISNNFPLSVNNVVSNNNELVFSNTKATWEGDSNMAHSDRIIYQEGFYYEPISDEVKTRIYGLSYKKDCTVAYEELRYVCVLYKNFDNESVSGEIICNKAIAQDLVEIFYELYRNDYQIEKIRLIDEYGADDDISCAQNNTSCFNYRVVAGSTKLSKHALGLAIDINPFYNPYITYPNGVERISPPGSEPYANRDADLPHMIQKGDLIYNLFIEHGFTWGGEWKSLKDYQHFEKAVD